MSRLVKRADADTTVTAGLDLAASGEDTGLAGWASANADLADSAQDMAQAFAAGTAATPFSQCSRSWATRPNGRRSSCGS